MNNVRRILFTVTLMGLLLAIACTKLGPVPDFEYSYDFKPSLPEIDTTTLRAETINITPGSIDVSGYSSFSTGITNPATAANYAAAANTAFTAAQKTYWAGQTQGSILTALTNSDATAISQVNDANSSFLSSSLLSGLVPQLTAASGNLISNAGRLSYKSGTQTGNQLFVFAQFFLIQDQELEDCRQAAIEAFDAAVAEIDDLLTQQLANIQTQYDNQLPLIEGQRAGLESAAQSRHDTRLSDYLSIYTTTASTIASLFSGGDITAAERDLLEMVNLASYAASVNSSFTLLASELSLIDTLIAQATANLTVARDSLTAQANTNYNRELARLTLLRDTTISKCHNQGGTNIS